MKKFNVSFFLSLLTSCSLVCAEDQISPNSEFEKALSSPLMMFEQGRKPEETKKALQAREEEREEAGRRLTEEDHSKEDYSKEDYSNVAPSLKELTKSTELLFNKAKTEDTPSIWKEAAEKAQETKLGWEELLTTLTSESPNYNEALFQKDRWELKESLAEIRSSAQERANLGYNDFLRLINLAQAKKWPKLETAIDQFLESDHSKAAIEAVRRAASAYSIDACASAHAYALAYTYISGFAHTYATIFTDNSVYAFACAPVYTFIAATSEPYEAYEFSKQFQESLEKQKTLKSKMPYSQATEEQTFLERAIQTAAKTTQFCQVMKKIKDEEERKSLPLPSRSLEQKALLAELKGMEQSAEFKQKTPEDRFKAINDFVRNKSWPAVAKSMQEFIDNPHETIGTSNANPIEANDAAEVIELIAQDLKKMIDQTQNSIELNYAFEVASKTAVFLRAVAEFKKKSLTSEDGIVH